MLNSETVSLSAKFYALINPSLPNEWEVDEAIQALDALSPEQVDAVFAQIPAIWPVSQSLCFSFLDKAEAVLSCLPIEELAAWVQALLDQYERSGLRIAQRFMDDVEQHFLCRLRGEGGAQLSEVTGRLQPYASALLGFETPLMPLEPGAAVFTDTCSIFLPEQLTVFTTEHENLLLYKLLISFQWGFIRVGTFAAGGLGPTEKRPRALSFFNNNANPALQRSLYHFFETVRVSCLLRQELPGLMRAALPLLPALIERAQLNDEAPHPLAWMLQDLPQCNWSSACSGGAQNTLTKTICRWLNKLTTAFGDTTLSLKATTALLPLIQKRYPSCPPLPHLLFQGVLRWDEVAKAQHKKREERAERFISTLAAQLIQMPKSSQNSPPEKQEENKAAPGQQGQDTALVQKEQATEQKYDQVQEIRFIRLDNENIELTEELRKLAEEILRDMGKIPEQYISSAVGKAGDGVAALLADGDQPAAEENETNGQIGQICYDEWDYRRKGFRRNWCVVSETPLPHLQTNFIANTLQRYQNQIRKIRRQFELLQSSERFLRRQREGNDIDIDALIESLADRKAGQNASERVFIRLARDERDIAVYFLVDMSHSTEGWVGKVIKETLVLLCESLQVLGDRYGIYGFSGMKRLRCQLYPVKRIQEPYNETVRQRIGSIAPKEYTRMAPAIRHMTHLFQDVEAKIRLLILLTDGKPEDYDDYKGEYAIEDTRHALLEARTAGIHPFCVTVDRRGQEYMGHMCGENQYICIDSIERLPDRMPQIYRSLTT